MRMLRCTCNHYQHGEVDSLSLREHLENLSKINCTVFPQAGATNVVYQWTTPLVIAMRLQLIKQHGPFATLTLDRGQHHFIYLRSVRINCRALFYNKGQTHIDEAQRRIRIGSRRDVLPQILPKSPRVVVYEHEPLHVCCCYDPNKKEANRRIGWRHDAELRRLDDSDSLRALGSDSGGKIHVPGTRIFRRHDGIRLTCQFEGRSATVQVIVKGMSLKDGYSDKSCVVTVHELEYLSSCSRLSLQPSQTLNHHIASKKKKLKKFKNAIRKAILSSG